MAKRSAAALLDGDDVAGNTPPAPPQDPAIWDRAEEDAKRKRRGEPPLTDDEWNTMRADADGVVPDEPAKAPPKGKGGKGTSAATKAAADRAEAAHEAKRSGKKAPEPKDDEGDKPAPKKRGRKSNAEKRAEAGEPEPEPPGDPVRNARSGNTVGIVGGQILQYVERYEKLEEEKKSVNDDQKEVLMEAKGNGFDIATIRRILKVRKMDKDKREEADTLFDLYWQAMEDADIEENTEGDE